jgi:hypothetical protein
MQNIEALPYLMGSSSWWSHVPDPAAFRHHASKPAARKDSGFVT